MSKPNKIAVLTEAHFDENEFKRFNDFFPANGIQVDYLSYLWGQPSLDFTGNDGIETVTVDKCVTKSDPADYDAVILIGGYAMDRLRYETESAKGAPNRAPAVDFLRKAVAVEGLTIGTICHSLWLFCAAPELLKGKRVTCAHNVICDVANAGGDIQYDEKGTVETVVDGDLVTAKHPEVVDTFIELLLTEITRKRGATAGKA